MPQLSGLVIDIETGPRRRSYRRLGTRHDAPVSRTGHCLKGFSALGFYQETSGACCSFQMTSVLIANDSASADNQTVLSDMDALATLDRLLSEVLRGGIIVTFNGKGHDLPFLMNWRHCLLRQVGVPEQSLMHLYGLNHCDVMLSCRSIPTIASEIPHNRWPSLVEACGIVGVPHSAHRTPSEVPKILRKSETDVLATYLLYMLLRSRGNQKDQPFVESWAALARWCLATPTTVHRTQFALCPAARIAAREAARVSQKPQS